MNGQEGIQIIIHKECDKHWLTCAMIFTIPVIFFLYQQPVLPNVREDGASIEQHLAVMAAEIHRADSSPKYGNSTQSPEEDPSSQN